MLRLPPRGEGCAWTDRVGRGETALRTDVPIPTGSARMAVLPVKNLSGAPRRRRLPGSGTWEENMESEP